MLKINDRLSQNKVAFMSLNHILKRVPEAQRWNDNIFTIILILELMCNPRMCWQGKQFLNFVLGQPPYFL